MMLFSSCCCPCLHLDRLSSIYDVVLFFVLPLFTSRKTQQHLRCCSLLVEISPPVYVLAQAWPKRDQDREHVENKRAGCLLEIICQSGSGAAAPVAGFLGKCA